MNENKLENKLENIMQKKLSIRFNTWIVDDDENEEEVKVFELKRKYLKMNFQMSKELANLYGQSEKIMSQSYMIHEEREIDYQLLKEKIEEYNGDFCFDLDILSDGKKIGYISLTRVFVNNPEDVRDYIDYESPQSLDIAHYICNVDYEKVHGTYIAIYDCFVLYEEYQDIGIEREVIDMLDSFLIEYEFEISKTYIKAISISSNNYSRNVKSKRMLKILKDNEYELGDSDNYIMYSNFWDFDEFEDYI